MNNRIVVNTEGIRKVCLEIQEYSDKIKNVLNQISDVWDEVKITFEGNEKLVFDKKFSDVAGYFDIIYKNFSSYIDEFNQLIFKYEAFDNDLSKQVNINTENIIDDMQSVYKLLNRN